LYLFLAIVGRVSNAVVVNIRKYVVSKYTLRENFPRGNSQNSRVTAGCWQYRAMQINVIPHSSTYLRTQLRKYSRPPWCFCRSL